MKRTDLYIAFFIIVFYSFYLYHSPKKYDIQEGNREEIFWNKAPVEEIKKSRVNSRSKWYGKTPLMCSVEYNRSIEVIEFFLEKGANPNLEDDRGRTVFDYLPKTLDRKNRKIYLKLKVVKYKMKSENILFGIEVMKFRIILSFIIMPLFLFLLITSFNMFFYRKGKKVLEDHK
jgi:hypothetical protein